jgi:hypothetical protein
MTSEGLSPFSQSVESVESVVYLFSPAFWTDTNTSLPCAAPLPIPNFGKILTVFVDVLLVLD